MYGRDGVSMGNLEMTQKNLGSKYTEDWVPIKTIKNGCSFHYMRIATIFIFIIFK